MTLQLTVPNLACSACAETVTKAIQAIDATAQVMANPQTKQITVTSTATETAIKTAIVQAGYTVA